MLVDHPDRWRVQANLDWHRGAIPKGKEACWDPVSQSLVDFPSRNLDADVSASLNPSLAGVLSWWAVGVRGTSPSMLPPARPRETIHGLKRRLTQFHLHVRRHPGLPPVNPGSQAMSQYPEEPASTAWLAFWQAQGQPIMPLGTLSPRDQIRYRIGCPDSR